MKQAFPRVPFGLLLAFAFGLALWACNDRADAPLSLSPNGRVQFAIQPRFAQMGAENGASINRIRITARDIATHAVVGTLVTDVDPNATSWNLPLDIQLTGNPTITVEVTMELLHIDGGTETIEWSGLATIVVTTAQNQQVATVNLFRGPPSNLTIVAVHILRPVPLIVEGSSALLTAQAEGASGNPQIFWLSLDPTFATIDEAGLLLGVRPGSARIIAMAGPRADTVTVTVSQRVFAVEVTPTSASLSSLGATTSFQGRVLDPRGVPISGAAVIWTIADAAIADNLGNGEFRARANGETTITAASVTDPLIRGSARLVVGQRVASLDLSPRNGTLTAIGAHQQYTAVARDEAGNVAANAGFSWSSSAPGVATIDANGLVTATGQGTTTIRVSSAANPGSPRDSVVTTTTLTVSQSIALVQVQPANNTLFSIDETVLLTARAFDGNAVEVSDRSFNWSSTNPAVARVNGSGVVTAVSPGEVLIRAETGGVIGEASVRVQPIATEIVVSPAFKTAVLHEQVQYNATSRDRNGHVIAGSAPVWTSSNAAVVTIAAGGLATVVGYGTATITATINDITGHAELDVPRPVRTVTVHPSGATLNNPGETVQLTATVIDAAGMPVVNPDITWTSLDTGVADVSATGLVTAHDPGTVTITATSGDATGTASITVLSHAPIAFVKVEPSQALMRISEVLTLSASAYDVNENLISGATFTWSSSDATIASVSSTGVVTARRPGNVVITVTSDGQSATSQITVYPATATTLEKVRGDAQDGTVSTPLPNPLVVRVLDQFGRPMSGILVQWVIETAGGRAQPDNSVTDVSGAAQTQWTLGPSAGAQSISARAGAVATLRTTFSANALASDAQSVEVAPANRTMTAGDQFMFFATARDASNEVLSGVIFSWSSSDTLVARVDGRGQVTAGRAGTATITATANGHSGTALVTVIRGPANGLSQYSGSGQSGHTDAELPDSLRVQVIDAEGNPVSGYQVDWVVTAGGGTVSPTSSVSDANGLASTKWTLGALVGTQSVEARATGLAGSPSVFIASGSGPQGVRKTWIGGDASSPTNWSTPGNWLPAGIPSDLDTAYISAAAANQPAISGTPIVGGLIIEPGAQLDLSGYTLIVYGSVLADGAVINVGNLQMRGTNLSVRGRISSLQTLGTVQAIGDLTVDGLIIDCPNDGVVCTGPGDFAPNGHTITVMNDFGVSSGTLTMTNAADQLIVVGDIAFAATDETGHLTNGTIFVGDDFSLGGYNSTEFVSTGTHLVMNGTDPQVIALSASSSTGNRLFDLTIATGSSVTAGPDALYIANTLTVNGTFATDTTTVVDVAGNQVGGSVIINSGGVVNNVGTIKANLPITNNGTLTGNPVIQR